MVDDPGGACHRRRGHGLRRGVLPGEGRSRRGARRAARPEHAGVGPERGRPARSDPAGAVPRAGRGVGAGVRAGADAAARLDRALARPRRGARDRPRGERLRRALRRLDRGAAARARAQGGDRADARQRRRAARARRPCRRTCPRGSSAGCCARTRARRTRCSLRRRSRAPPRRSARGCCCGRTCTPSSRRARGFRVETSEGELRCGRIVDCGGTEIGSPRGRPAAGRALADPGVRHRGGAAARRAPSLLRGWPADAEAGALRNGLDRRRLAVAAGRPRRPRVAGRTTSGWRSTSSPRSRISRCCAPGRASAPGSRTTGR